MNFKEIYNNETLRALSWKEPFGSLMLHGKIETRTWDTKYRGLVLICTSKKAYDNFELLRVAGDEQFGRIEEEALKENHGQAIAIGRLIDSRPMIKDDEAKCFVKYVDPWEKEIISSIPGIPPRTVIKRLWCHVYADVHAIFPFDWKGAQGWRTVSDDIKNQINFVL